MDPLTLREVSRACRVLLAAILDSILDDPNAAEIELGSTKERLLVQIRLAPTPSDPHRTEFGRLLGREGRTLNAIRRLLTVLGARYRIRVWVDVVDGTSQTVGPV